MNTDFGGNENKFFPLNDWRASIFQEGAEIWRAKKKKIRAEFVRQQIFALDKNGPEIQFC